MVTMKQRGKVRRKGAVAVRDRPAGVSVGVPRRALADGVMERRRTPRRRDDGDMMAPTTPTLVPQEAEESQARALSAEEHYRREQRRRAGRAASDLAALLAEAKAEYEALINAPRPAGKGGRPRKKVAVRHDDDELED